MKLFFTQDPEYPLPLTNGCLTRDTSKTCISRYCSQLPEHSHYDKSDLNPFFYRTLSQPIPQWFFAVETAMLQIYSTVYEHTLRKINSHAFITKTYHEGKPLPLGTFVLKRNLTHLHFSDKLKQLRIGPYKIIDRLSDVYTIPRIPINFELNLQRDTYRVLYLSKLSRLTTSYTI